MGLRSLNPMVQTSDMDRTIARHGWNYGMPEFAIKESDGYVLSFGEPLCPGNGEGKALSS